MSLQGKAGSANCLALDYAFENKTTAYEKLAVLQYQAL